MPSVGHEEDAVAINAISDPMLMKCQPVGCGVDRDNGLAVVCLQISCEAGAD
jgi:hypothetical protein